MDEDQNQVNERASSAAVAQSQRYVYQQLSTGNTDLLPSASSGIQQELEIRLEPAFANRATTASTTNDVQEQSYYPDPTRSIYTTDTQQQSNILQAVSTNNCDAQTFACPLRTKDKTDTSEGEDVDNICDDQSEYSEEETLCAICCEMEKSTVMWYRCKSCGQWAHKECSGSGRPEDHNGVFCLDP
ncbi:hypothetical protein HHI36_003955 [Cryptolaemus montrouzieri]|uniref:Zinc finger PHD-type domain-containing protein n=1 Tax=Cryptolaemus montrouzieri TaxID=559131 RepID=A0ABD2NQE1_9CUCU